MYEPFTDIHIIDIISLDYFYKKLSPFHLM